MKSCIWIRSWRFDLFWILSGLPFGAALMVVPHNLRAVVIFYIILAVQTAHTIAPMCLAWSHDGFRALMLRRRIKYIAVPIALLAGATLIGMLTRQKLHFNPTNFSIAVLPRDFSQIRTPFMMIAALYTVWNAFHFGKQAFGVLSIYRGKSDDARSGFLSYRPALRLGNRNWSSLVASPRSIDKIYCCTVVWAAMAMPFVAHIALGIHNLTGWPAQPQPFFHRMQLAYLAAGLALPAAMLVREWFTYRSLPRALFILTDGLALILIFYAGLWGFAIIALNHWLVAIGLASHVDANANHRSPWSFAIAVMGVGFVLFCLLFFDPASVRAHGLSTAALSFTATAVGFRLGLGFVHFLYDRWCWRRPTAIMRDALATPQRLVIEPFPAIAAE